ncbi:hypothetical protein MJK71_23060 [Escherichia coli]|nr:hypothetical protein MJK71_23060 [Escherichia coli]
MMILHGKFRHKLVITQPVAGSRGDHPAMFLHAELNAKTLQRLPGDSWRVTSYSGLQQRGFSGIAQDLMPRLDVDAAGVASVVEEPTLTPHRFARGASPGTFLHSLFEDLDFTQPVDPNGGCGKNWNSAALNRSGNRY